MEHKCRSEIQANANNFIVKYETCIVIEEMAEDDGNTKICTTKYDALKAQSYIFCSLLTRTTQFLLLN